MYLWGFPKWSQEVKEQSARNINFKLFASMFSSSSFWPTESSIPAVMQLQIPFYVICLETNVMF